jgi:7-cyano-7-deazaguanine synthase
MQPDVVSFFYGQRHAKELKYAEQAARRFGARFDIVDISKIGLMYREASTLIAGGGDIPEGHYAHENMAQTVVPNRNMTMASIAVGVCVTREGSYVGLGPHNGDAAIYPDCRPAFWREMRHAVAIGNEGFLPTHFDFYLPFLNLSKREIAVKAKTLGVPLDKTWSCYKGEEIHCGRCGTCVERLEAIDAAHLNDPTQYADTEFWKTQVNA